MALCAAKSAGCAVPSENIDRAVDYLKRCAVPRTAASAISPAAGPEQPQDRHRHPRAGNLRRAPHHRGRRRRRVSAQAPAPVGQPVLLLRGLLLPPGHVPDGRQVLPRLLPQARRDPARAPGQATEAGSPATATTAPAAATTAPRWPSWRWRLNIATCRSINDEALLSRRSNDRNL